LEEWRSVHIRLVHRLVAEAFIGLCPEGLEVNHKDGNKANCRADNLEYTTKLENFAHAVRHGLNGRKKITPAQVLEIRKFRILGTSVKELSRRFGITESSIAGLLKGRSWCWVK